jgi:hypothetical protein
MGREGRRKYRTSITFDLDLYIKAELSGIIGTGELSEMCNEALRQRLSRKSQLDILSKEIDELDATRDYKMREYQRLTELEHESTIVREETREDEAIRLLKETKERDGRINAQGLMYWAEQLNLSVIELEDLVNDHHESQ